jgi:hypothetical protein
MSNSNNNYWVGLGQNVDVTTCPAVLLSGVYENSWNWTWIDGTPLLRDSRGQGLVFFPGSGPSNNGNLEHFGGSYLPSFELTSFHETKKLISTNVMTADRS